MLDLRTLAVSLLSTLAASVSLLPAQDASASFEKLRRDLKFTGAAAEGLKTVADVGSLAKPSKVVSELAKTLGAVATGANAANKLFDALASADDAKAREKLLQENSKLPAWMQAALDPMQALKKVEAKVDAIEIPVFECTDKDRCLTLADLTGDKAAATTKARALYKAHREVVRKLEEQVEFFTEIIVRADAASAAMRELAKGWRTAAELGCGVLGSYCGLQYLEADELVRQCNAISSSAKAQNKKAKRALALEQPRVDKFASNMRDLFGIDVMPRGR